VAALGGFFFSIWSLIATYLVHIVEVKERQQWRDVAQTSLDSLSKQVLEVCEMATVATHASVQRDGSAKQGSPVPDSPLYRSLKSFDRVFEIISPVLTTTPDLGQAYLRLSKWRMAAWRFHHLLREGREDDAIESWEIAERERHEWFGWLQRDGGLAYQVLDSNAFPRSTRRRDARLQVDHPRGRRSRPDRGFAGLDCGGELRHRDGEDRLSARSAMFLVAGTSST